VVSAGSLSALLGGAREARRSRTIGNIPADLPVYVFSGSDDPVHGNERGLRNLLEGYRSRLHRVDYRLYPEGRHEMLNEVNRHEVVDDLIAWLNERMGPAQS
jgi:alpha-beta hydrolase superfamily lysophospholipase